MSEDDIQRYEQMLADDPESRAFAPLAEAYRKAGRLDDAIRVARAGLEVHPGYSGGLLVLGRALYESRELDPAAEVLQKAVADSPENYLGQKFLGKALMDKGDIQGAIRAFEAANFLSPEDEEVARILEEMKKKAEPPKEMKFETGSAHDEEEGELVTYEQKPTTVDGVELAPLPVREAFSFSPEGEDVTLDPAAVRLDQTAPVEAPGPAASPTEAPPREVRAAEPPAAGTPSQKADQVEPTPVVVSQPEPQQGDAPISPPVVEAVPPAPSAAEPSGGVGMEDGDTVVEVHEEEFEVIDEDLPEVGGVIQVDDMEDVEQYDPEVAAFIEEGESLAEASAQAGEVGISEPEPQPVPTDAPEPPGPPGPVTAPETQPPPPLPPAAPTVPGMTSETTGPVAQAPPAPQAAPPAPEVVAVPEPAPEAVPMPEPEPALDLDLGMEAEVGTDDFEPQFAPAPPSPLDASTTGSGAISTETLADLYAQQGLTEKALEIYGQILSERPGDEVIQLKISALREAGGRPGGQQPAQAPVPEAPQQDQQEQAAAVDLPPAPEGAAPAAPAASGTEGEIAGDPGDEVSETLGRWLENVERMKKK